MHPHRLVLVAIAALVAFAGVAQAADFSVTSANKQFCCTTGGNQADNSHTASGYVMGTPASKYGSIQIGQSQVVNYYNQFSWWSDYPVHGTTAPPVGFKYIIGTRSFVNGAGTLQSGGGYGTFDFCPKNKGPGVGACANPGLATPASFNGRISVKAGPNQFGGTLQILSGSGGIGGTDQQIWRWIGGSMTYPAAILPFYITSTVVGAATPAKHNELSGWTTKLVTHQSASTLNTLLSFNAAVLWVNGAGPFTTGTAYIGVTANGTPATRTVSIMGYNKRTAAGQGNIQVVSGMLFNTFNNIKNGSFPIGWQLNMALPEPSPSLGLATGSLALLLVGLIGARRRK